MRKGLILLSLGWMAFGCATGTVQPGRFDVTLEVDFGPARKPPVHRMLQVGKGATPESLTAQVFPVGKGSVCCDPREVAVIDGVATDPAANRWWTVSVNGSKKVSPYKTQLKPGDVVRWEYRQSEQ